YELHVINKPPEAAAAMHSQADRDTQALSHFDFLRVPASASLEQTIRARMPALPGYRSEINLQGESWVSALGQWLDQGVALLLDYGFPQHEYYHPQRSQGTLMCHLLHHAHSQALHFPGIQDITAHVDFTAMADAALAADLEVLGYTSQARFLLNCGLLQMLSDLDPDDTARYAREIGPV